MKGYKLIGPLAYRGKEGCESVVCTRLPDSEAAGRCYGWHCSYCDEPCSSQGHRCDAADAILNEARAALPPQPQGGSGVTDDFEVVEFWLPDEEPAAEEAYAALDRLRQENERLRGALERILGLADWDLANPLRAIEDQARHALCPNPKEEG